MINESNKNTEKAGTLNHCSNKNRRSDNTNVINLSGAPNTTRPRFSTNLRSRTYDSCQRSKKSISRKSILNRGDAPRKLKKQKSLTKLRRRGVHIERTAIDDNNDTKPEPKRAYGNSVGFNALFDLPGADSIIYSSKHQKIPITTTPSGCLKISPNQLLYNSNQSGVEALDPKKLNINVLAKMAHGSNKNFSPAGHLKTVTSEFLSRMSPIKPEITEEEGDGTLTPEMTIEHMMAGIPDHGDIDYPGLALPIKTNLYHELYRRISNYLNTDVQVIIGEEEFSCHSMVLQSYSAFFEKKQGYRTVELPIEKVTVNAFIIVYDWMITGHDCINLLRRENILNVFLAAQYLHIKELEEQCWAFLDNEKVFFEDSAFVLFIEAKKRHITAVKELMIPRVRNFFLVLVSSQDYLELELDEVCAILNSNYIAVNCEMEVLMSAVRWLKYDWKNRMKHICKIFSCVRFGLIAPWQLVDVKRNPENPELLEIMAMPDIVKMVDDGLSFVIIKYWYGHKCEDYSHWIELLGLTEPHERNWAGNEKNYITYKQFLSFLDSHRREHMLEKSQLRKPKSEEPLTCIQADYPPPELAGVRDLTSYSESTIDTASTNSSQFDLQRRLSDEDAASFLQNIHHSYKHQNSRVVVSDPIESHKHIASSPVIEKPVERTERPIYEQNLKVLSMFATHTHKQKSPEKEIKKIPSTVVPIEKYLVHGSLFNSDRESILLVGGLNPHKPFGCERNTGRDIYRYMPESNSWNYVAEMPEPRQNHATAFFKGRVYLAGGAYPGGEDVRMSAVNTVWSFEPVKKTWHNECPMMARRKGFGLIASNMKLYAISGQDNEGKMLTSVERFDPGGHWVEVAPLKLPRMGAGYAKYRDTIFVVGGMVSKRNRMTDSVESYDTRRNEWTRIANLRSPRCCMSLITMNDKLYVIGGAIRTSENLLQSIADIDVWNPHEKHWENVTEMVVARHGHCVGYLGMQIFIIGGITTTYMRALSNTECYCCERETWIKGIAPLPLALSGHCSVTLPPASLL